MKTFEKPEYRALVDAERGLVSRRIFHDRELYEQEQKKIFEHCWLYLGHESQLRSAGDFFTAYMGEEPVLVTSARDGSIRAFVNSCPHRGMRVCRADSGSANSFTCAYHGWTFNNEGKLIGVPMDRELYQGGLDRELWGLTPVAQLASYKGLIFGSFDPDAPPLIEYLGTMALYLDTLVDRNAAGTELIGGVHKWRVRTNWKIAEDNNSGDEYHVPYNHGSYLKDAGVTPADFLRDVIHASTPEQHNFSMRFELPNGSAELPFPILSSALRDPRVVEYLRSAGPEAEQRLGRIRSRVQIFAGTVFPNFSLVPLFSAIRVVHPRGPNEVEVWSWCIVDRDAPPAVKQSLLKAYMELLGPSGLVEQDDSEIWEACTVSSQISVLRDRPYNYQMGLGKETWHEGLGCTISDRMSEAAQRGFYRHWTRLMERA